MKLADFAIGTLTLILGARGCIFRIDSTLIIELVDEVLWAVNYQFALCKRRQCYG